MQKSIPLPQGKNKIGGVYSFFSIRPFGGVFIRFYGSKSDILWYTIGTLSEREKGTRNGN